MWATTNARDNLNPDHNNRPDDYLMWLPFSGKNFGFPFVSPSCWRLAAFVTLQHVFPAIAAVYCRCSSQVGDCISMLTQPSSGLNTAAWLQTEHSCSARCFVTKPCCAVPLHWLWRPP